MLTVKHRGIIGYLIGMVRELSGELSVCGGYETADIPGTNTILILGEVRGQLREIIHTMNSQAQKNDAVAAQLAKLEGVPARLDAIDARLVALEADRHRRDGAMGFGGWLLKSPLIGWLVGFGVAAWAYLTGKIGQ